MSNYKTIAPPVEPPLSFVKAVRDMGDLWGASRHARHLPFQLRNEETHDRYEAAMMSLMEEGQMDRSGFADLRITVTDHSETYPRMEVGEHGFGYCAHREDYDGAPDSHCLIGIGYTKAEAIAELISRETER